jgi:ribosomal protein S18 acetylase RimI-like enzyme
VREIDDRADLAASCHGDTLLLWAAQGLSGRNRAWTTEDRRAVVVAGAAPSSRDRLAVWGDFDAAAPLVREVVAEVGPTYRPLGDRALIALLVEAGPDPVDVAGFGWMDCSSAGGPLPGVTRAAWLPTSAWPEVGSLVQASYPASWARPGVPGVERWAGVRDGEGRLAAVGALAWSAPDVGFLSGIAVRPQARRRGFGGQVCRFLLAGALGAHGAAALMVDDGNHAARRLYEGLGLRYRPLGVAAVTT